ncbi:MAG: hypothetical protein JSR27_09675 [Proteobacteria bacterium]|nr:hypothetical protein [Pseudomonadota bacterium]
MGLLDELEQQAQQRKASADDAEKRKSDREQIFRTQLEPGMVALHEFLGKLVANLKLLQPKKPLRYALVGYGDIVGYIEHEYDLKLNQQPGSREIVLGFHCAVASEECPTVEVLGASKVKTVAGAFQRYHLGGVLEPKKDGNGETISAKFNAKGRIPMTATFFADADSAAVRMNFVNFDALGTATKNVPATQLNEATFDAIGRYLMREDSNLFQEALSDSFRAQLRTKVQQDQIKRRWESKISEQQKADLARMKREQGLSGSFAKPAAVDDKPAGSSWLDRVKGLIKK